MSDEKNNTFLESVLKYWPIIVLAITLAGGAFTSFGAAAVIFYKFSQSEGEKKEMKAESTRQYSEILGKLEVIKESVNDRKSEIATIRGEVSNLKEKMASIEEHLNQLHK